MTRPAALALCLCLLAFPVFACSLDEPMRSENPTHNCPDDIKELAGRVSVCIHWGGEEAYDDERAKQIEEGWAKSRCDEIACDLLDAKESDSEAELQGVIAKLEKAWTDAYGTESGACKKS